MKFKVKKIFEKIYRKNGFGGIDSISGPGSNLAQTLIIRQEIPIILKELNVDVLLDVPCGDFYWMKYLDLEGVKYIGGDIVEELIEIDNRIFSNEYISFTQLNLLNDNLPSASILLCRDCLVHMSYKDIFKSVRNIKRSSIKYLLTTSFTDRNENKNIRTGEWRPINLNIEPFFFPKPLKQINEHCSENNGIYSDKSLLLWNIVDLPDL